MNGCARIERYVEVIAKRRTQRRLEARRHLQEVNHRRETFGDAGRQHFGERAGFRLEPLEFPLGRVTGLATRGFGFAGALECVLRVGMRDFRGFGRRDADGDALARLFNGGRRIRIAREAFHLALHGFKF